MLGLCLSLETANSRGGGAPAAPLLTMQNTAGTTVTNLGSSEWSAVKSATDAWGNASATSVEGYSGNFIMRFEALQIKEMQFGMNSDPLTDNSYQSIDFGIHLNGDGTDVTLYENATTLPGGGTYTAGSMFFIKRTGSAISIGRGGTDGVSGYTEVWGRTSAATLYVDSALYYQGFGFKVKRIA